MLKVASYFFRKIYLFFSLHKKILKKLLTYIPQNWIGNGISKENKKSVFFINTCNNTTNISHKVIDFHALSVQMREHNEIDYKIGSKRLCISLKYLSILNK